MTKPRAREWYRVVATTQDPTTVDIHIIDWIGDWVDDAINRFYGESIGVTARAFVEELSKLSDSVKTIRVHINSPGGDVFGALNIANALREQRTSKGRTVETVVDGLAASAASIIMMAGSVVRIADNALVMVHNPWTCACGSAKDFRKFADDLDTVRNTIVATYKWHSELEPAALIALMDAETWMDADEAIANGLATEKVEGLQAAASLTRGAVAKLTVPEKYRARVDALLRPEPSTPQAAGAADVLRLCREGGCLDVAEDLIGAGATLEAVQSRVSTEQQTRARASERQTQIRALCEKARLPELAASYIAGGMPLEQVRAQLTVLTAKLDQVEIDGGLSPDHGSKPKARINVSAVYAELNAPKQ